MNRFQQLVDRFLNDEKDEAFDYEPADQSLVEPDTYTTPDVGDAESAVKP